MAGRPLHAGKAGMSLLKSTVEIENFLLQNGSVSSGKESLEKSLGKPKFFSGKYSEGSCFSGSGGVQRVKFFFQNSCGTPKIPLKSGFSPGLPF